ncbi:MAG: hypothetical protein VXW91_06680, partial [Pseudomonadota bacterium]|nr:hypothetical protein [Pseudomonadota bacterium]
YVFEQAFKRQKIENSSAATPISSPQSHPLLAWRNKPKSKLRELANSNVGMRIHLPSRFILVLETDTVSVYRNLKFEFMRTDYQTFFCNHKLNIKTAQQFTLKLCNNVVGNDLRTAISSARSFLLNEDKESEGFVLADVGENEAKINLLTKNGFTTFLNYLKPYHIFAGLEWYANERIWARHKMVRPLRKSTELVDVLQAKTIELCYDPQIRNNIPVYFYLKDYKENHFRIDRELLLENDDDVKLHLQADGENVLTLQSTVKRGEKMLGVFAATDMPAGSKISIYLGTEVTEANKSQAQKSMYAISLQQMWLHSKELTTFEKQKKFFCDPDDAYCLAHFFNSSDFYEDGQYVNDEQAENCRIGREGIIQLTKDVLLGDELLWRYGQDYYHAEIR